MSAGVVIATQDLAQPDKFGETNISREAVNIYKGRAYLPVGRHGMFGGMGFGLGSTATPDEIATRQQTMFQNEANLLGLSVDDVKAAWAAGKSLPELAQDKGITTAQLQLIPS